MDHTAYTKKKTTQLFKTCAPMITINNHKLKRKVNPEETSPLVT